MKIIHCADLHLDSQMETHLSSELAKDRRFELLETFYNLIEYGKKENVTAIIIAGDMFDTPQNEQKNLKDKVLNYIRNTANIDFLYLQGNHDNSDDFFAKLVDCPINLKLFDTNWTSFRYGDTVITGIVLDSHTDKNYHSKLNLSKNDVNIVVLHGQVVTSNNCDIHNIFIDNFKEKNIDYMALGHIHSYSVMNIDLRGKYVYSGCLEGRGFDECGKKGFVVINIEDKKISHEFISLSKRCLHKIEINITSCETDSDVVNLIDIKLIEIPSSDMIKIIFIGEVSESFNLDIDYINRTYKQRFYIFKTQNTTEVKIDYDKYKDDISLKGEFIRLVKNASDIPENQKGDIISRGIQALIGKELI